MARTAIIAAAAFLWLATPAQATIAPAWRSIIVPRGVAPPADREGPLLALIDTPVDAAHPALAGANLATSTEPIRDAHGTAMASLAVAVWPSVRIMAVVLPEPISCEASAKAIQRAIAARAAVISMAYGSTRNCPTEWFARQQAVAADSLLVAAAGDERNFPGAGEHVLAVGAVDLSGRPSAASAMGAYVDLAAPGVGVLAATPPSFDSDGTADGYQLVDGTGAAATIVAALAAWVRAERPRLRADQVATLLRLTARDLGARGRDAATGWGIPRIRAALARTAPVGDRAEPNDNIGWVDGRLLKQPNIWSGGAARTITARLRRQEDPVDVFPIRLRPHGSARVTLTRRWGNPNLSAHDENAFSVDAPDGLIARATRRPGKEVVELRNPRGRPRTYFLAITIDRSTASSAAGYRLRVTAA